MRLPSYNPTELVETRNKLKRAEPTYLPSRPSSFITTGVTPSMGTDGTDKAQAHTYARELCRDRRVGVITSLPRNHVTLQYDVEQHPGNSDYDVDHPPGSTT
jgi:hypothetical protein